MKNKLSLQDWINQAQQQQMDFATFCVEQQSMHLERRPEDVLQYMRTMLEVMEQSIETGLSGIPSKGGLVGGSAKRMNDYLNGTGARSVIGPVMGRAVTIALAVGEANAAMGKIVAAPTAGSSGVIPAVLFSLAEAGDIERNDLAKALTVAGAIGMVISSRATLSGAEGGCQAECGSAAAMAAGAAVILYGGSADQVGQAVAISLKNMLGLVCDPVAGLVEVPCVKRNAGAVSQAMVAAEMALAGIKSVIPVDEVIDAMAAVGAGMSCALRETAKGGLAVTPTALEWSGKIQQIK